MNERLYTQHEINTITALAVKNREVEIIRAVGGLDFSYLDSPTELFNEIGIDVPKVDEYILIKAQFKNPFVSSDEKMDLVTEAFDRCDADCFVNEDWEIVGISTDGGFKV